MIRFVIQKIKNKKILSGCLILGIAFLVATISCQPMFKQGALDKLLDSKFNQYILDENKYPSTITEAGLINCEKSSYDKLSGKLDKYPAVWHKYLSDIDVVNTQKFIYSDKLIAIKGYINDEGKKCIYKDKKSYTQVALSISHLNELDEHIKLLDEAKESNLGEDFHPCYISAYAAEKYNIISGELLEFVGVTNSSNKTLKLYVKGIIDIKDSHDCYWNYPLSECVENVFIDDETLKLVIDEYSIVKMSFIYSSMFDYSMINTDKMADIKHYLSVFKDSDAYTDETLSIFVNEYDKQSKTVGMTLWVLEIPLMCMVFAFIYMISKQIVDSEKNEIAMLKSRGIKQSQIVYMYMLWLSILAAFAYILGIALGYGLCKLAAASTDFATFDFSITGAFRFNPWMLLYGFLGVPVAEIFVLIPVIISSKVSIVQLKANNAIDKKPFWKKYFLDVIMLALSLYFLYNFLKNIDELRDNAMAGNNIDPTVFVDAFLFIVAMGLIVLRLINLLVKLIYRIGKNKWKPATYASFLQITRTTGKQGFISVFLVLTVSLGLFYANTARTINRNNIERIEYDCGTDRIIGENWPLTITKRDANYKAGDYVYSEPSSGRFDKLTELGLVKSCTKVITSNSANISFERQSVENCQFMAINTKEFGETARLKDGLNNGKHWYNALNALAGTANGVIISSNLAKELGAKEDDIVSITRYGETEKIKHIQRGSMGASICAIVDDWPGYNRYYYDEEGNLQENYLMVINYETSVSVFKISPYQVWCAFNDGTEEEDFIAAMRDNSIVPFTYINQDEKISNMKGSPSIQITNGMFTMGFVIALILCTIGFLIYWISSIKQRELLFGVYRAMGISVKEINKMLVNEHLFSTLLSIIAGAVVGFVSTILFVKLFGAIYLPQRHNLEFVIFYELKDMIKLFIAIVIMILSCFIVLKNITKKLNITNALKLGEE